MAKMKFKLQGTAETRVKVQVEIESPRCVLTRNELKTRKSRLANATFKMLTDFGYDVDQINFKK